MNGTYLRLDITVHDGWRTVISRRRQETDHARAPGPGATGGTASLLSRDAGASPRGATPRPNLASLTPVTSPSSTRARPRRAFCIFRGHHAPFHHRDHLPTLPVYRQRAYDAETLEEACRLAVEDDDWSEQKEDYESSGETYVTGAWPGEDTAYRIAALPIPAQFGEMLQRKTDHYETLLGILKVLAHTPETPFWRERTEAAIAKAEAILAGAPGLEIAGGGP